MNLIKKIFGFGTDDSSNVALKKAVQNGAALIDVRMEKEFAGGSVDGAINIPLSQIKDRNEELVDKKEIVVFCRSGNRSGKALSILKELGFSNVINGGSWKDVMKVQGEVGI